MRALRPHCISSIYHRNTLRSCALPDDEPAQRKQSGSIFSPISRSVTATRRLTLNRQRCADRPHPLERFNPIKRGVTDIRGLPVGETADMSINCRHIHKKPDSGF